jgi:hypothetical protein
MLLCMFWLLTTYRFWASFTYTIIRKQFAYFIMVFDDCWPWFLMSFNAFRLWFWWFLTMVVDQVVLLMLNHCFWWFVDYGFWWFLIMVFDEVFCRKGVIFVIFFRRLGQLPAALSTSDALWPDSDQFVVLDYYYYYYYYY